MLFKNYIIKYYEEVRLPNVRENTAFTNLYIIQKHIVESFLGEMDIKDIRAKDIEIFLQQKRLYGNKVKNIGLSTSILKKLRQLIIACLEYAVKEEILDKNYGKNVSFIKVEKKKSTKAFSKKERDFFLENTKKNKYWFIFYLLFYTGCRRSEILGLSWDNIDFIEKTITIEQTLIMVNQKVTIIKNTKTSTSNRTLPLPDKIMKMLENHKKQQDYYLKNNHISNKFNLVFINDKGNFINPMYVSRNFKECIKRLNMNKDFHIHCTRHTWATLMIHSKASISDIQYLGGWSRPDVLLNIYAHTIKNSQREAMDNLF